MPTHGDCLMHRLRYEQLRVAKSLAVASKTIANVLGTAYRQHIRSGQRRGEREVTTFPSHRKRRRTRMSA